MRRGMLWALTGLVMLIAVAPAMAQPQWTEDARRADLERIATVEKKLWVTMRDGVRLSTDVYRPKDATGPLPTIFWRTP
ncbi:MAG: acylase, partial [Rhodothalassiaceae bacterium]